MGELTQNQIDDIRHTLGWSHTPKVNKLGWRNYYWTKEQLPELDDLVAKGFMVRHPINPIYQVTKAGAKAIGMSDKRIKKLGDVLQDPRPTPEGMKQVWPEVEG